MVPEHQFPARRGTREFRFQPLNLVALGRRHRVDEIAGFFDVPRGSLGTVVVEGGFANIGGGEDHARIDDKQFDFVISGGWRGRIEGTVDVETGRGFQIADLRKTAGSRRLPIMVAQRHVGAVKSGRFHQVAQRVLQHVLEAPGIVNAVSTERGAGRVDVVSEKHTKIAALPGTAILRHRGRYCIHARCGNHTPRYR